MYNWEKTCNALTYLSAGKNMHTYAYSYSKYKAEVQSENKMVHITLKVILDSHFTGSYIHNISKQRSDFITGRGLLFTEF